MKKVFLCILAVAAAQLMSAQTGTIPAATHANGWVKVDHPVMGGPDVGTCFDANVIPQGTARYNMYFSWRPQQSIALSRSDDGENWSEFEIVLRNDLTSGWEDKINRASILYWDGRYHMWYTGQARGYSKIGYAVSDDGIHFTRVQKMPVMVPTYNYEGFSVMNPHVLRDEERGVFRMWYACGETYEPNMIAYAESVDGIHWERSPLNPIYIKGSGWEQDRIGGCEVHELPEGGFIMFYIGYSDIHTARIGAAVSPDGITQWKRLESNPLVEPTEGTFDASACYKPTVCRDEKNGRWQLWYNGRNMRNEYIGYAIHDGLILK